MPTYVAFLRAINLGAKRKFPKDAIKSATEAAGGSDVETYINTGNVRLTHRARSAEKVRHLLQAAYSAEAGFEVPTIVFTSDELAGLVERGERLHAHSDSVNNHYVTLYPHAPDPMAVSAVSASAHPGERCVVDGRAAHALLEGDIHNSKLLNSKEFKALGAGTARTIKVLRTVRDKWCG